ncbi:hypothetical protein O181_052230 [Austropuccinia psidii MF-1]|uniref:Uncharacterized protein n=1 Tax=Austropuccinia psidii MF-1 TaxID=1389203 RepID=A0A9Q3HSG6_9BASI|nr:hypothetical protein [Austropuccinia psidii MF-1]
MSTQSQYMAHCNDGDQKNLSKAESESRQPEKFEHGQVRSHLGGDSKDQRSIANRLDAELKRNKEADNSRQDPNIPKKGQKITDLAKEHGNKPSRGACIDDELREEEEEMLRKKGIKP